MATGKPILIILALAAALALSAGCSTTAGPTPIVFNDRLPFDPGPDVGGRALQDEIFADGQVTFDEYERAYTAAIQCMRDEGFEVQGPLRYPDGYTVVEPGWDPNHWLTSRARVADDPTDRYGEVNGRCQAQWSYAVETVYRRQFEPSEEEVQAWLQRAWDCARDNGLEVSTPPTVEEATAAVSFGCRPWEQN